MLKVSENRVMSREQSRVMSREWWAESDEQRVMSREWWAESGEQRVMSREQSRVMSREWWAESDEQRVVSREWWAESGEQRVMSREQSRVMSREWWAESGDEVGRVMRLVARVEGRARFLSAWGAISRVTLWGRVRSNCTSERENCTTDCSTANCSTVRETAALPEKLQHCLRNCSTYELKGLLRTQSLNTTRESMPSQ